MEKKHETYKEKYERELKRCRELVDWAIEDSLIREDNLRNEVACSWAEMNILNEVYDELVEIMDDYGRVLSIFSNEMKKGVPEEARRRLLEEFSKDNVAAAMILKGLEKQNRARAQRNANRLHDKPGGSRWKQNEIRKIWASGKYATKDQCAAEECEALGMSFSTARKALRNQPPSRS